MFTRELLTRWTYQVFAPGALLRNKYNAFKELLKYDDACLELIAELEDIRHGTERADWARVLWLCDRISQLVGRMVQRLVFLNPSAHMGLPDFYNKIDFYMRMGLDEPEPDPGEPHILDLAACDGREDLAGGKAANLARAMASGLPVPGGFTATANACAYFVESAGLRERLDKLLRQAVLGDADKLADLSGQMREMVMRAEVPESLARDIAKAAQSLAGPNGLLAVRSSAVAEDGETSFAGQYDSILKVSPTDALDAYKRVVAGKYSPGALSYRILAGLPDTATPMAVLFMPMLSARASGVAYGLDPAGERHGREVMALFASQGDCVDLVQGRQSPEPWLLTREAPPRVVASPEGDTPLDRQTAQAVGEMVAGLEKLFGAPQDVEWLIDASGKAHLLQSRPLAHARPEAAEDREPVEIPEDARVLIDGADTVSPGLASGKAAWLRGSAEARALPMGAVAVAENLDPSLSSCLDRVRAVVAASGSRAGHFASVAREFGLPVLVTDKDPFALLPEGGAVTVDATRGNVFAGDFSPPDLTGLRKGPPLANPLGKRLEAAMPRVAKLNLTDPDSEHFSPEGCKSMHDLVRYAHERAVGEMFSLVGKDGRGMAASKKLKTHLPLVMYVLDLGGGLFASAADKKEVAPEEIAGTSMWAFWWGLADPRTAWSGKQTHVDWEEFDRVSAGIFSVSSRLLASYAIIARDYMHLMIRFGYHFSVVDSVCAPEEKNNYVNFRFKGGGGSYDQRLYRLEFIRRILEKAGFTCRTRGDMLDARFSRHSPETIQHRLVLLGRLCAMTRLMDMGMSSDTDVDALVRGFFQMVESRKESES